MAAPTLSVVVPLHNAAPYIGATLSSLAHQTVPPDEVVVVDDGSTDEGPDIVRDFRLPDGSRPVLVQHEFPLGVAMARNHGVYVASGNLVGLCDNDDLWLPARVERVLKAFTEHPERQAIATGATSFALEADRTVLVAQGRAPMVNHWLPSDDPASLLELDVFDGQCSEVSFDQLRRDTAFVTTQVCFRRESYAMAGGCAPWCDRADDWVLNACLALQAPILRVDSPLVLYRVRAGSQSHLAKQTSAALLAVMVALRFGRATPTNRAGLFYFDKLAVEADAGTPLRTVLGFALLGNLSARETASLLKRATKAKLQH